MAVDADGAAMHESGHPLAMRGGQHVSRAGDVHLPVAPVGNAGFAVRRGEMIDVADAAHGGVHRRRRR